VHLEHSGQSCGVDCHENLSLTSFIGGKSGRKLARGSDFF